MAEKSIERRTSKMDYRTKIIAALTERGPMTCAQLMAEIGSTLNQTGYAMSVLREDKLMYISGYAAGRPIYSLGRGEDAPRPLGQKAYKRRHRTAAITPEEWQARRVAKLMAMLPASPRTEWRAAV